MSTNIISEFDELIDSVKEKCSDLVVSQINCIGEKPFESGVWKIWLESNKDIYVNIEVLNGTVWALYGSKEFNNKYPIEAVKICEFLSRVEYK